MENEEKVSLIFAAIDRHIVESIPKLTQDEARGRDFIQYGDGNDYPNYLWDLYNEVATLKTIIQGTSNFVSGNDSRCNVPGFTKTMNHKGDTLRNMIRWISRDWLIYGSFALQVIRNAGGGIAEVNYVDVRYLRSDKKNESFWYSEDFGKKYARSKALVYPKYIPGGEAPASILYCKNDIGSTYPYPLYSGALKACEIERKIDEMHLNSLENGFMGSYIINFLNGVPDPTLKEELEKQVNSKFCGSQNAGRVLLNFANGEENAAKVERLDITDFADKYKAAAERSRQQIYCSFQAIPQLFGNMTAATGFSEQEFKEAYNLYNGTVVRNIQRIIGDAFDQIFQVPDSITIDPFSIDDNNVEQNVN